MPFEADQITQKRLVEQDIETGRKCFRKAFEVGRTQPGEQQNRDNLWPLFPRPWESQNTVSSGVTFIAFERKFSDSWEYPELSGILCVKVLLQMEAYEFLIVKQPVCPIWANSRNLCWSNKFQDRADFRPGVGLSPALLTFDSIKAHGILRRPKRFFFSRARTDKKAEKQTIT